MITEGGGEQAGGAVVLAPAIGGECRRREAGQACQHGLRKQIGLLGGIVGRGDQGAEGRDAFGQRPGGVAEAHQRLVDHRLGQNGAALRGQAQPVHGRVGGCQGRFQPVG